MKTLIVIMIGLIFFSCGKNNDIPSTPTPEIVIPVVTTSRDVSQKTPKGAIVYSKSGVTTNDLADVDAGLDKAFADGILSGWVDNGTAYNYSLYNIYIPVEPCIPSPKWGTPTFKLRADNYDGTIYDQYNSKGELPKEQQTEYIKYVRDGVGIILAAELVLQFGTTGDKPTPASFIVCQGVLKDGSRYGAEHNIIRQYDPVYFQQTQTHTTIPHPLLPKRITE